jgi:hypothetical protein
LLKLDLAENLRIYRTVADRLSAPASNMVPLDETDLFANVPRYALVARSLDRPWLSRIMLDVIGDDVALTLARTAIASELFRRRHGNWPRESDELAPAFLDEAPRHPLTGNPVDLRHDNTALHLYLELSDERFPGLSDTTYARMQLNQWTLTAARETN